MVNTTQGLTELAKFSSFATDETSMKMRWTFYFVIFPITSLVGIAANVTSTAILVTKDLKKTSNSLLIFLALSDIMFLFGLNNFPRYIMFVGVPQVFQFSYIVNYILYIFYVMFLMFYTVGLHCSLLIPVLITGERLLAIFTPLTFTRVVTPILTFVVVSCLVLVNIFVFIYSFILCFGFRQVTVQGVSVGLLYSTERYHNDVRSGFYQMFADLINHVTGTVPIVLVMVGSCVIGVKVTVIINKRRQLTSTQAKSKQTSHKTISRTTKTLFSICILYIACSGFAFVTEYVTRIPPLNEKSLKIVLGLCKELLFSVNSVGNFVIYVAVNKTFRNAKIGMRCRKTR